MKKLPFIVSGVVLWIGLSVCLTRAGNHAAASEPGTENYTTDVFVTVDEVSAMMGGLAITGILEGEGSAVQKTYFTSSSTNDQLRLQRCERLALLAFSKPGAYRFSVTRYTPDPNSSPLACGLTHNEQ